MILEQITIVGIHVYLTGDLNVVWVTLPIVILLSFAMFKIQILLSIIKKTTLSERIELIDA